jgi:hypothetical protein
MAMQWQRYPAVSLLAAAVIGGFMALGVAFAVSPRRPVILGPPTEPMALSLADLPDNPLVPTLNRAGMPLANLSINTRGAAPVIVAAYRGLQGCRLELRSYKSRVDPPALVGTSRHRWTVTSVDYELVAHGMDAARFDLIADAAERQTRPNPDTKIIDQKLRQARRTAKACKE